MDRKDVIHGAIGITKATLDIDCVDEWEEERRLDICLNCVHKIKKHSKLLGGLALKCNLCECYIKFKVKLIDEKCDLDKW